MTLQIVCDLQGLFLYNHQQRSGSDEGAADDGLGSELLVEQNRSQDHGDDHAELIDGHNLRGFAHLQGFIVAQPGGTGGHAGEDQEDPAFLGNLKDAALGVGEKHHTPR